MVEVKERSGGETATAPGSNATNAYSRSATKVEGDGEMQRASAQVRGGRQWVEHQWSRCEAGRREAEINQRTCRRKHLRDGEGGEDRKRRKVTKGSREKDCGREREALKGEGDVEAQWGSVEGAPKN